MLTRFLPIMLVALLMAAPAAGQVLPSISPTEGASSYNQGPKSYEIMGLSVEGVENQNTSSFVQQASGLSEGQTIQIPGGQAVAEAVRSIYEMGMFEDVEIAVDRKVSNGIYLTIRVDEVPKLASYSFTGIDGGQKEDLREKITLVKRTPVRQGDIERAKQAIRSYFKEKGYLMTEVKARRTEQSGNTVNVKFIVDRGEEVEVEDIRISGNEAFSESDLRGAMSETREDRWWRFWKSEKFDEDTFQQDLQGIIDLYNEEGYYDARIVRDTTYIESEGGEPGIIAEIQMHEGPRYHIRDITWEGNTVFSNQTLISALGLEKGDVYNGKKMQRNLRMNRRSSDVSSLYMDRGYMKFNVEPRIREVGGDSLDITFDVREGDVYEFGDITIAGNTKTKEHVIRRELYTIPGRPFSRSSIQESIRRLQQLKYFSQESLTGGPGISVDEGEKEVDLTYDLEEVGSDQLELSGTWGRIGLILQLRFTFNNFSAQNLFNAGAWQPLPTGDGQKLSVGIRTNGRYYQNYSLSFREPWFRGRPTPVGFALSYSRYNRGIFRRGELGDQGGGFVNASARTFYERRLQWPDDHFSSSTGVQYQYYDNDGTYPGLPTGVNQEITFQQSFSRNSLNNPRFPTRGSRMSFSLDIAPPIGNFVQYHKWRFKTGWNVPLLPKVSLGFNTDYGYIGSLTGDPVDFQRFLLGGSPFDAQGRRAFFGKDEVYMRGYPYGALGPRSGEYPIGGRILNKYNSELRWLAIQSPQFNAAPYLFADAANAWGGLDQYNPAQLYRSAGVGARIFLPMVGMVELTYGYNFDEFMPVRGSDHTGERRWYFQFSLGRGFNN